MKKWNERKIGGKVALLNKIFKNKDNRKKYYRSFKFYKEYIDYLKLRTLGTLNHCFTLLKREGYVEETDDE